MITPVTTSTAEEEESPEPVVDAIDGDRMNSLAEDEGKLNDLNAVATEVMVESTATDTVIKVNIIISTTAVRKLTFLCPTVQISLNYSYSNDGTSMRHASIGGFIYSQLPTTPEDRVRSGTEHRPAAEVHEQRHPCSAE